MLFLDSHKPTKYSRHLLLRPHFLTNDKSERIAMPLAGSPSAKVLARLVCAAMGERLRVQTAKGLAAADASETDATATHPNAQPHVHPHATGEASAVASTGPKDGCIVDLGVYTRNRCFRIVGSSKLPPKPNGGGGAGAATNTVSAAAAAPRAVALTINDTHSNGLPPQLCNLSTQPLGTQIRATLVVPNLPPTPSVVTLVIPDAVVSGTPRPSSHAQGHTHPYPQHSRETSPLPSPTRRPAVHGTHTNACADVHAAQRNAHSDAPSPLADPNEWLALWDGITPQPLLDTSPGCGPRHPFVRCALMLHSTATHCPNLPPPSPLQLRPPPSWLHQVCEAGERRTPSTI